MTGALAAVLLATFSVVPLAATAALAQTDESTPPDTTATTAPDTTVPDTTAPDPTTTTAADTTTAPDPTTTTSSSPDPTTTTAPTGETASLIVKTIAGLSTDEQQAAITRNGGTQTSSIPALRLHVVSVPSADRDAAIASFQNDTDVASVSIDTERAAETAATDPSYPDQWALPQIGWDQVHGEAIAPTGTANLAVLDTGVDPSAPDLTDVGGGWSAFGDTGGNNDPNGHGTHMATIAAAAADDGTGIAGVASTGVHVMPIQVLGADGTGTDSDIITGLVWAVDHGADVALMAFSNPGQSAALQDAINYAWSHGVVVVAAAGNDGSTDPTYPAGDAKVVGVGATDQTDALWSGSNQSQAVFLGAPGVDVLASDASGTPAVTGTSASAAQVAGAAALLREADPSASNGTIVGRLARNADPLNGSTLGNGRINVERAITDTDTTEVVPEGAPGGGPVVGPYVVDASGSVAVTLAGTGAGTVTSSPAGINCTRSGGSNTGTCSANFTNGATVTLTVSSPGSTLSWTVSSGTCTGSTTPCTVTNPNSNNTTLSITATLTASAAPTVDLNGGAGGTGYASTFTEDGGAVPIVDSSALTVGDADTANLQSATATLTTRPDTTAESLAVSGCNAAIAVAPYNTSTGVLALSGSTTLANYQACLRTLTYNDSSQNPTTTSRNVNVVVNDGTSNSATAAATITVNAVNDAPVVDLNGNTAGTGFSSAFTEDGGAVSIVSNSGAAAGQLSITDVDSTTLTGATATLTSVPDAAAEVVAVTGGSCSGITPGYASGVLTLSGSATLAAYQTCLRTLTYNNTSQAPTGSSRTVNIVANDGGSPNNLSAAAVASISITAVNDAPVLDSSKTPTIGSIAEDVAPGSNNGTLVSSLISSAGAGYITDADGPASGIIVTAADTSQGSWQFSTNNGSLWTALGSVSGSNGLPLAADGSTRVRFLPAANFAGTVASGLTFRAWDGSTDTNGVIGPNTNGGGNGGTTAYSTASDTASIVVTEVNDAPVPAADSPSTSEDNSVDVNVVANDSPGGGSDEASQTLTVQSGTISSPAHGTATLLTSGAHSGWIRYTPNSNFNGPDSFTYVICDDGTTSGSPDPQCSVGFATVSVSVSSVNDPPAGTDNTVSTNENVAYTFAAADFGFSDPNDSPQNNFAAVEITTTPATGSVQLSGVPVTAGQIISAANVTAGNLKFVPASNTFGSPYTTFTFQVQDNGGQSNGGVNLDQSANTMTVNVIPVNHAPVLDNTKTASLGAINEDDTANTGTSIADLISSAGAGYVTDTDVADPQGIAVTAADGTNGSWEYSLDNGTNWSPLGAVSATNARLLPSDGVNARVRFVPGADYNGLVDPAITFRAWDQFSGTSGGTADPSNPNNGGSTAFSTATDTASITVTPVNDAPSATGQSPSTNEDTSKTLTLAGSDLETAGANLSFTITSLPTNGTLYDGPTTGGTAITSTGYVVADGSHQVTFDPTANYNGPDSFKFTVSDRGDPDNCGAPSATCAAALTSSEATVSITVNPVNDAPSATGQSPSTNEDTSKTLTLAGADVETSPADLTVTITSLPTNGTLYDGPTTGGTAITSTGYVVADGSHQVTFDPTANYNGPDSFKFTVTDRGDPDNCGTVVDPTCTAALTSSDATVSITVDPVNDAPSATGQSPSTNEDTAKMLTLAGTDVETSSANLTVNITSLPANGTLYDGPTTGGTAITSVPYVVTDASHRVTFDPTANYNGPDSFKFTVSDRGDPDNCGVPGTGCAAALTSTEATVSITVNPVNDAPSATGQSPSTNEDTSTTLTLAGTDVETAPADLTVKITSLPTQGNLYDGPTTGGTLITSVPYVVTDASHQVTFDPTANYNGPDGLKFTVTDRGDPDNCGAVVDPTCTAAITSTEATVSITVNPVNDAPSATAQSPSTNEDTSKTLTLAGTDVETLPANLGPKVTSLPASGVLKDGSHTILAGELPYQLPVSHQVSYVPNLNYNGPDSFKFTVTDRGDPDDCGAVVDPSCTAALTSTEATVSITVNPVNDAPSATAQSPSTNEDTNLVVTVAGTDVETSPANLTPKVTSLPANGVLKDGSHTIVVGDLPYALPVSHQVSYVPNLNYNGPDSFKFTVTDRGDPDNCGAVVDPSCTAALTSTEATVSITVNPVNDAPSATAQSPSTNEDTNLVVTVAGTDVETSPANLTPKVTSLPANGVLKDGSHTIVVGDLPYALPVSHQVTYVPNLNYNGADSFKFTVTDRGDPDNCGVPSASCAAALTSSEATVSITVIAVDDAPVVGVGPSASETTQYSDPITAVTVHATDVDSSLAGLTATTSYTYNGGSTQSGLPSGLTLGAANVQPTYVEWTVDGRMNVAPGTYVIRVTVNDNDSTPPGPLSTYVEFTITVTSEDARVLYTGDLFDSTGSGSSANVTLSATVRDISTADPTQSAPNPDLPAYSGDIRKARVKFVNRDTNTDIAGCINLTPSLVNLADLTVGTVTCSTPVTLGSSVDSTSITVGVVVYQSSSNPVTGWYTRNNSDDNTTVTVSRSLANFITGGGYLTLTNSSGQYLGDVGSKMNFGFNVKYNKSGTNLQGGMNVIVRSNGHVYQIKSNSIQSLSAQNAGSFPATATFTAKANLTDITNPNAPIALGGNLTLQAKMTDKGEPGSKSATTPDSIAITLNGGSLFSSNWNGTATIEQALAGGNLQVR